MKKQEYFMTAFFRRLMLIATVTFILYSCGKISNHIFADQADSSIFRDAEIAQLDEALTFAREKVHQGRHIIAVTRFLNGKIVGVDLTKALNGRFDNPYK
jgi:hypothetical protein